MRIKMITTMAGPEFSAGSGQEVSVLNDLGERLVVGGFAINITPIITETADIKALETTVLIKAKKGKK